MTINPSAKVVIMARRVNTCGLKPNARFFTAEEVLFTTETLPVSGIEPTPLPLGMDNGVLPRRMSAMATEVQQAQPGSWQRTVKGYIALMKLRVVELLLVTTVPTMIVAKNGWPSLWLIIATLVGGTLAAGGANAINMVIDRDIDAVMERTKNRPLVTGVMTARAALIFALAIELLAFIELWVFVNLLSAVLAVSATLFYVFVYTIWLKRRSSQNIVIGGAAGAVPVLVGWSAVTNSLAWPPVILFVVIFIWTPPHFWALAVRYRDDYEAADVPMLPVVASMERTTLEMLVYTVVLAAAAMLFGAVAHLGLFYGIVALLLNIAFIVMTAQLYMKARRNEAGGPEAMKVFHFSITYLTLLFVAMAGDVLLRDLLHKH